MGRDGQFLRPKMDGDQCGSPAVINTVWVKKYSGTNLVWALANTRDRTLFESEQHSREIENVASKKSMNRSVSAGALIYRKRAMRWQDRRGGTSSEPLGLLSLVLTRLTSGSQGVKCVLGVAHWRKY